MAADEKRSRNAVSREFTALSYVWRLLFSLLCFLLCLSSFGFPLLPQALDFLLGLARSRFFGPALAFGRLRTGTLHLRGHGVFFRRRRRACGFDDLDEFGDGTDELQLMVVVGGFLALEIAAEDDLLA